MVPELHRCQMACHWLTKKTRKSQCNPNLCRCEVKHDCQQNWHIHIVCTNFFPPEFNHEGCGLGKGKTRNCIDHKFILAHLWPYGISDVKKIENLRLASGKLVNSPAALTQYLTKYLMKSFEVRYCDPVKSRRHGLLKGMGIYKFYRKTLTLTEQGLVYEKIQSPIKNSQVYINFDATHRQECEAKIGVLFKEKAGKLTLKRGYRKLIADQNLTRKSSVSPVEILLENFKFASQVKVAQNHFWRKCRQCRSCYYYERKNEWIGCDSCRLRNPAKIIPGCEFFWNDSEFGKLYSEADHVAPLTQIEFVFKGNKAYRAFQEKILPLLSRLNLEKFYKFTEYSEDYEDLEHQFYGGDYEDYLRWVSGRVNDGGGGLSAEAAMARYADY